MLSSTGVNAGTENRPQVLRMPPANAVSEMNNRYGNVSRSMATAKSNWSRDSANPGANTYTSTGAANTPTTVMASKIKPSVPATTSTSSCTSAVDSFSRVADKTGTNDCANAPSANSRRMKLGILNATRNASICGPAPNSTANSTSRANPNTRDVRVKPPTTPLERAIEADLECFSVTLVDMQNKGIFK